MKEEKKNQSRHSLANMLKRTKRKLLVGVSLVGIFTMSVFQFAFAVTPAPSGMEDFVTNAPSFFDIVVSGAKKVAELFTVWPINLFLGITIVGVGAGLFAKFRHS